MSPVPKLDVQAVVEELLRSPIPSIRYKAHVNVLDHDPASRPMRRLQREVRDSPQVAALLHGRDASGRITQPSGVYAKW